MAASDNAKPIDPSLIEVKATPGGKPDRERLRSLVRLALRQGREDLEKRKGEQQK
jgi:hypothetical protein